MRRRISRLALLRSSASVLTDFTDWSAFVACHIQIKNDVDSDISSTVIAAIPLGLQLPQRFLYVSTLGTQRHPSCSIDSISYLP